MEAVVGTGTVVSAHQWPGLRSLVLWLGERGADDVQLVGGKSASLSQLAARYPVPPGFCLTTEAFALGARHGADLVEKIPPSVASAIRRSYASLAAMVREGSPGVAVRSSAVDEDGVAASFAGQHETFLNVSGESAIADAVHRCWTSLRTERALEYRRRHGLVVDGIRLAVLVQQLVPADVSAVVFSANPITRRRDEVVINASWGLGESVVGGTVTPDTYVVRRDTLQVVERRIGEKCRMTVAVAEGTREVDVPRLLRSVAVLGDAQAVEMARLALDLEAEQGGPVDVECAWHREKLYLLQCRRITTLGNPSSN